MHTKTCLLSVKVLLILSIIYACSGRLLLADEESKPEDICGEIGNSCCLTSQQTGKFLSLHLIPSKIYSKHLSDTINANPLNNRNPTEFGITQLINTCQDGLFCQEFPTGANTGASLLETPSLCLPIPSDTCGQTNGACCPKTAPSSISPCSDPNTLCILSIETGPSFRPATGSLTYEDYLSLKNTYQATSSLSSSPPQQLSATNLFPQSLQQEIMGTCTQLPACGQPDGLCGSTSFLPPTSPQCFDKENQGCPADYFCEQQQGQRQPFSFCKPQPLNCGGNGQQCCPPGTFYSSSSSSRVSTSDNDGATVHQLPFCKDTTMYCAMDDGTLAASQCRTIPAQGECGSPGQQCCPPHYRTILMDPSKTLPLPCQDGSYCNGMDGPTATSSNDEGSSGLMCVENDDEICGAREGAACCGFTRPAGITEMSCSEERGLRCPTELLITQDGVMHDQLKCVRVDADDAAVVASLVVLEADEDGGAAVEDIAEDQTDTTTLDDTINTHNKSSNGPSTAVIVGISTGIAVAAILCIISVVVIKKRYNNNNNNNNNSQSQDEKGNTSPRSPKVKDTRLDEKIIFVADKLNAPNSISDDTQSDKDSAFDDDGDENA